MNNSQLILIEGLPGAGKSTNSRIIMSNLEQMGKKVRWVHEVARPHPTLFFHEANLTIEEYKEFIHQFPEIAEKLESIKIVMDETICIDLLELEWNHITEYNKNVLTELQKFDVWNFTLEKYIKVAIEKWKYFVANLKKDKNQMVILDSSIFQFQIYTFLEKNTPIQLLENFIEELFTIISDLNPLLIYLYRENVEDAIKFIEKARGVEFFERIWERDKHQPYYELRPSGAEGYREFLRDYHKIAQILYHKTPFQKLGIDVTEENWVQYESEILSFLNVKHIAVDSSVPFPIGKYENKDLNMTIEIHQGYLTDPTGKKKKLIPKSSSEFYLEDLPMIICFEEINKIVIRGEQLIERWTTNNTEFTRI